MAQPAAMRPSLQGVKSRRIVSKFRSCEMKSKRYKKKTEYADAEDEEL